MIGIYQDEFVDYLKNKLGDHIKTSSKNIICPCPWCEYGEDKNHYHMYISIEIPIFHCFHANCEQSGSLKKFLSKLEGHDISDEFIDKDKLIAASPAIQNLISIVSILGQFVKNHEALFFSFFEKYKEG